MVAVVQGGVVHSVLVQRVRYSHSIWCGITRYSCGTAQYTCGTARSRCGT